VRLADDESRLPGGRGARPWNRWMKDASRDNASRGETLIHVRRIRDETALCCLCGALGEISSRVLTGATLLVTLVVDDLGGGFR